jgi:hypothetical protein
MRKIISHDHLPNYGAKILPDDIHRANPFHAHLYHHLLTCPDGDNQWFWVRHLAHVGCAESDLWSGRVRKISHDHLPNYGAKILPDDIHRANQSCSPTCHHLLTCTYDGN